MVESEAFLSAFTVFIFISIGAILILWIAIPLSIFAIKDLLKECVGELKKTRALLKEVVDKKETNKSSPLTSGDDYKETDNSEPRETQ